MDRPAVLGLLCADETYNAQCLRRRTATAQLRFLLSSLLLDMTHDATNRFMRDSICCCHGTERFFLLYHKMHHHWPLRSWYIVCRMFWSWTMFANNRRRAGVIGFIKSEQLFYLEIQFPSWGKEEVENWRQRTRHLRRFRSIPFSPLPSKSHALIADPTSRSPFSTCLPQPKCQQALPTGCGADPFGSACESTTEASQPVSRVGEATPVLGTRTLRSRNMRW